MTIASAIALLIFLLFLIGAVFAVRRAGVQAPDDGDECVELPLYKQWHSALAVRIDAGEDDEFQGHMMRYGFIVSMVGTDDNVFVSSRGKSVAIFGPLGCVIRDREALQRFAYYADIDLEFPPIEGDSRGELH